MTLLAPAECLLGLTSDLAAFKRVFVFDELALREVVKSAKCDTQIRGTNLGYSAQGVWVCLLGCSF